MDICPSCSKVTFKLNLPVASTYMAKEQFMLICPYKILSVKYYGIP